MEALLPDLRRVVESQPSGSGARRQSGTRSKQIGSIAVLPFADESHEADSEYLSEGITETLINSLSQIPKLRVVPRSTVFRYRGRDDIGTIAQELDVRAVLTGRVAHRGDRIVVAAELIDPANDAQLWGEQYSRPVSDLLDVQKTIAEDIARHLRPRLSGQTRRRVVKIHTEDPEAYQLYLKGLYHMNKRLADSLRKAVEFFQQAIDRDPAFARGYAGLADAFVLLGWYAIERPRVAFPRALAAARQALAIDATYAEAQTSAAYATLLAEWDRESAEAQFQKALLLNPNYPYAHHWYADLLQGAGRAAEAIEHAKRACALDPLALILNAELGRALYYHRSFDRSIEQQQKMLDLEPNFTPSLLFVGQAYDQSGRPREAVEAFRRAVELTHENPIFLGFLAYGLARDHHLAEAKEIFDRLRTQSESHWTPAYSLAMAAFGLQDLEETHRWLGAAIEERSHWLLYANADPAFAALWEDPRFADLRQRLPANSARRL
jgi:serine/threonine-protein kinase